LIKTTVDKNGDMVIDIASTQAAIKEHMENDTETQSNNLDDVDFTKEKWENLSPSARLEYGSIDRTIEKFTQDTQSIDSDIFQTK